ncbi:hypothetical protein [Epilithonimonas hungarica]|uniref:Uncharacterized protein n=1 Tax=Epilithonimonas hungarica TaxID=454006 RepID=A0A1G7JB87_9FLAO|nr:hypothetical protein [Epilithonimonas hungarica]MDP9956182.1 hypothetical protein [Epilithonimonas hungarica]SDF22165.1 hypothetical protein SAMN05421825_1334 [Epilithonimonas hungarica]
MQNLKSKYEQKEMKVSDGLWDRLEEKLDQTPAKGQKPKMIWLRYVAVILLVFGLVGSFLMINNKSNINENLEFANHTNNQNTVPTTIKQSENNEVEKLVPTKNNSETDNQRLVVENLENSSTPFGRTESIKKENQTNNLILEKENIIKKEEPQITPQPEEKLAQNEIQKPRVKYVSSSDLLFGVEIDKAKSETPKSAMGINTLKPKNDSDFPNPKRIKLFGITLYDKDSITTK